MRKSKYTEHQIIKTLKEVDAGRAVHSRAPGGADSAAGGVQSVSVAPSGPDGNLGN